MELLVCLHDISSVLKINQQHIYLYAMYVYFVCYGKNQNKPHLASTYFVTENSF